MIPPRLRIPLAAAGASLILRLGFPDSLGLWPLRLLADWPGEIGRAIGGLLLAGHLGPLALSQASALQAGAPQAGGLIAAIGLITQFAAGVALFWIAERPGTARLALFALAACAGIAAVVPPVSAVTAAELGATLVLVLLATSKHTAAQRLGLQFLAAAMVTSPLAGLRWIGAAVGLGLIVLTQVDAAKPAKVPAP